MGKFTIGNRVQIISGLWEGNTGTLIKKRGKNGWVAMENKTLIFPLAQLREEKLFKFGKIEKMFTNLPMETKYLFLIDGNVEIEKFNFADSQFIIYTPRTIREIKYIYIHFPVYTIIIEIANFQMGLDRDLPILSNHFSLSTTFVIVSNTIEKINTSHQYVILKNKQEIQNWLLQFSFSLFEHELEWYL